VSVYAVLRRHVSVATALLVTSLEPPHSCSSREVPSIPGACCAFRMFRWSGMASGYDVVVDAATPNAPRGARSRSSGAPAVAVGEIWRALFDRRARSWLSMRSSRDVRDASRRSALGERDARHACLAVRHHSGRALLVWASVDCRQRSPGMVVGRLHDEPYSAVSATRRTDTARYAKCSPCNYRCLLTADPHPWRSLGGSRTDAHDEEARP